MSRLRIPLASIAGSSFGCIFVALGNFAASGQLQIYLPIRGARVAIPTTLVVLLLVAVYVGVLPALRQLDIRKVPPPLFYFFFGALLWFCAAMPVAQGLLKHYGFATAATLGVGWTALVAFVGIRLFTRWCIRRGLA
jgi:hypothetical protein